MLWFLKIEATVWKKKKRNIVYYSQSIKVTFLRILFMLFKGKKTLFQKLFEFIAVEELAAKKSRFF